MCYDNLTPYRRGSLMGFVCSRRKKTKAFPKTICASNQVSEEAAWQELASLGICSLANQPKVAIVNMSVAAAWMCFVFEQNLLSLIIGFVETLNREHQSKQFSLG